MGIKTNTQTDLVHRMTRQTQRQSAAARKGQATAESQDTVAKLRSQIEQEKENQRASAARTKDMQLQLKEQQSKGKRQGRKPARSSLVEASSSGRVKMVAVEGTAQSKLFCQL